MAKSKGKKILVVEDDFFLIKVFQTKLMEEGYEVQIASDGEIAFDVLAKFTPDLILLDLVMPKKDGFEVLEDLRKMPKHKKTPVIVLTNLGQESDIERVKKFGVLDYLVKSDIPINKVVTRVEKVFTKGK